MATVPTPLDCMLHALQPLNPPPVRPIYDNSAVCQRCGAQVRSHSYVPATSDELNNFVCVRCAS